MNGISSYSFFVLRLAALLGLLIEAVLLFCLLIGSQSSGDTISVFTTNTQQTTSVWVMDVSRNKFVYLQVTGHENNIPVWSPTERRILYYPRTP